MQLKDVKMTAGEVMEITNKYMIETYQRFPFIAVKAKDQYLYDSEGNAWLDFYGGIAVNSCGNVNEKVTEAIMEQAGQIVHTFNYPYTIPQAVLAKFICDTIGMDKIFYQNSGTEANEAMIKLARKYGIDHYGENRYEILTAKKGFHGRSFGALSATGQPDSALHKNFGPMLPGFKYLEFNNLKAWEAAVSENTIGVMIEPVQAEGGVIPATQEFMKGLRRLCDEKGLLFMLDEIQTGWGRCGNIMAYMNYGVKPDIVTMAKAMGGGMPIGAMCTTTKIAESFGMGSHGSTFGGNCLACAAACAATKEIVDRKLPANAAIVGDYFSKKLIELPHVKEVRGLGLLVGVVFDQPISKEVKHGCTNRRLLVTAIGDYVIRMVPPLIVTREDCDKACDIIKEAIIEAYQ